MLVGIVIIETHRNVNENLFREFRKLGDGVYAKVTTPSKIFKVTDEESFLEFFDSEITTELTNAIVRLIGIQDHEKHYVVAVKHNDVWDVEVYSTNKKFLLYRKDGFYIPFNNVDELYNNLDNWKPLNKDEKLPNPSWILRLDNDLDLYILSDNDSDEIFDSDKILNGIEELADQDIFKFVCKEIYGIRTQF